MDQPGGPSNHCLTSSGLAKASKTRRRGASKTRVSTISRSPRAASFKVWAFCIGDSFLPLCASTFFLLCLQLAEQGVQALKIRLPKTAVPLQPNVKLVKRRGPQGVDAALSVHANVHQAGLAEDAQVLRDLRLAETQAGGPDAARGGAAGGASYGER